MAVPKVFISYSHKDEEWKDRIVSHLGVVAFDGKLSVWSDRKIVPGTDWLPQITRSMAQCKIALLLVSANFLTSTFCLESEVPALLKRRAKQGLRLIPVIVKPCAWQRVSWLNGIQAYPPDGDALSGMKSSAADAALATLVDEVLGARHQKQPNGIAINAPTPTDDGEGGIAVVAGTATIDIKLDREFDEFSESQKTAFMDALRRMLSLGDVTVKGKRRGSVLLRMHMSEQDARRVEEACSRGHLRGLGVISAGIVGDEDDVVPRGGMRVRPLADRILVRRAHATTETVGGIYLPEKSKVTPAIGTIVGTGPGKRLPNGVRMPINVKKGDKIVFASYAGTEVKLDGDELLIMSEDDILAVLDE